MVNIKLENAITQNISFSSKQVIGIHDHVYRGCICSVAFSYYADSQGPSSAQLMYVSVLLMVSSWL